MSAKTLLLIDLSHIFWSTWHATAGQDVDAAYRVTYDRVSRMRSGFDAVVVCCDIGPSWRHELYPGYKANRPERDAAAYDQLRRVREQLEADGYPVAAVKGFEADDIIATLAGKAAGNGYETTIATGDKDLLQIVGGPVVVQSTNNGGGRLGPDEVMAKFGVKPEQLGDYLALVGDKSDNVPGVPSVGPKHAARLLTEYGNLDGIYDNIEAVKPPGIQEALHAFENREGLALSRKLVGLSFNVPLDFAETIKPKARPAAQDAEFEALPEDEGESSDSAETKAQPAPSAEAKPAPEKRVPVAEPVADASPKAAIVLDRQDPNWMLAMEPRGLNQLFWLANRLHESQLYRKFPNPDAIAAVIMRGRSMGLDTMTALDGFHMIEGKPSPSAMLIIGCVISSGKAEYFELVEHDNRHAMWATKRKGSKREQRMSFSVDDAHRIGLDGPTRNGKPSNWIKHPGAMCRKQAGVELARAVYPDVVANVYDPAELEDVG